MSVVKTSALTKEEDIKSRIISRIAGRDVDKLTTHIQRNVSDCTKSGNKYIGLKVTFVFQGMKQAGIRAKKNMDCKTNKEYFPVNSVVIKEDTV